MNASNSKHVADAPYSLTDKSEWGITLREVTITVYADPKGEWAALSYPGSQYGLVTSRQEFVELASAFYDHMMDLARARQSQ